MVKKQLGKPENWQDFESLCKKLWGEIWNCPEIKKNGRSGQEQLGVDIYGVPKGETDYYGIQCKGKDHYTRSKLTISEVDEEIEKAKNFKPKLKKFYFATTAQKDAKIEEYIRSKDIESRKNKGFEIHLFSWGDIVDLIDENRRTHDWYVENIGFKTNASVEITFGKGETHLTFEPKLIRNHVTYLHRKFSEKEKFKYKYGAYYKSSEDDYEEYLKRFSEPQPIRCYQDGMTINRSSCVINFLIKNDGNMSIENFKMYINIIGDGIIAETVNKQDIYMGSGINISDIEFDDDSTSKCVIQPFIANRILVQNDKIQTDNICLRPTIENPQNVVIDYKFVAKDFHKKGQLKIRLETEIEEKHSEEETEIFCEDEIRLDNYLEIPSTK